MNLETIEDGINVKYKEDITDGVNFRKTFKMVKMNKVVTYKYMIDDYER